MTGWGASFFWPHKVTVQRRREGGGMGPSFAEPVTVQAEVRDEQRLVRTASGEQVTSSSRVTVPVGTDVTVGSLVTVWAGTPRARSREVLAIETQQDTAPLPSFLVLSLQ